MVTLLILSILGYKPLYYLFLYFYKKDTLAWGKLISWVNTFISLINPLELLKNEK